MTQSHRIEGGIIDRSQQIGFSFNGTSMHGYAGDTLASALLANGVRTVGRSFKYHRPRGIYTAGSEEPNALMQIHRQGHVEPNTRATTVALYEGLTATSQNHRGPLKYDFMAINDAFAPMLAAGFYYKTFMWPKAFWEKVYEPIIRNSAGLGAINFSDDPSQYDHAYVHCDVLVIGAGVAGLMAALTAARNGLRVLIADEDTLLGGRLNSETDPIDGLSASEWAAQAVVELESMDNVRIFRNTTVQGAYDHGSYHMVESCADTQLSTDGVARQISWTCYSKRAILCAGSTERPIAFHQNDRPGIMLSGSVRSYANRWAVGVGENSVIFTNNDDGWRTARDLIQRGLGVAALVDTRADAKPYDLDDSIPIYNNAQIVSTRGRHGVSEVELSNGEKISCDCVAVSGGWNPNVHLTCHQRGRPVWDEQIAAFVPGENLPAGMLVAGSAAGLSGLADCMRSGHDQANAVTQELGAKVKKAPLPQCENEASGVTPYWYVKEGAKRAWVDFQNDVTTKDIILAQKEGFRSVEHIKRYTTLGMATDQGKTANVIALGVAAEASGSSVEEIGTTIFRPPYTPVAIGTLAGASRGTHYRPYRLTPSHRWAEKNGASFVESGAWLRAEWFVQDGETGWRDSVDREAAHVRKNVGICDVSTLGKIDIKGKDATTFINRIYANAFAKLEVGKVRYGLMLREDGGAWDDGTTARLAEDHYLMTTTTANAVAVFRKMEFYRQCVWPKLDVHLISVTDQFAQYAVAGPKSRDLLAKVVDTDISNEAFPFMACADISVCGGIPARLFRISFSGELAYEIAVATRYGPALIEKLMAEGEEFNAAPYGLEALNVLRIEKGHPTVNEINGQTTAAQLGLGRMVSTKKDSVGAVMSRRPGMNRDDDYRLVGFIASDASNSLQAGAHFVGIGQEETMQNDEGWLTSTCYSPHLERHIGLGFIKRGTDRIGERVQLVDAVRDVRFEVEIASAHFVDPEGERLRG